LKLKLNPRFANGYTLSALAHIILLVLLALLMIKPFVSSQWHSFEWVLEDENPSEEAASTKGVLGKAEISPLVNIANQASEEGSVSPSASSVPSELAPIIEQPKPINSNSSSKEQVKAIRRTSSALRSVGENLPTGNMGFSSSMEQGGGEAYIVSQSKPQIVPNEEGEVYLEFKLTPTGNVDYNSINVITYSSAAYVESVRRAMRTWKFGFRGAYNPDRLYRIRCKFVIDEQY